jgi:hypothetical protein
MSAIEEVMTSLELAVEELNSATSAAGTGKTAADEGLGHAEAAGGASTVAGYTAVRDAIDKLAQQITAAIEVANEAIGHARAIADGT